MDYASRIAKIETQLEANQRDNDRLYQAIGEVRNFIQENEARHDQGISELRAHVDQSIAGLRVHIDSSISNLRSHTDQQLADVRKEASVNMQWLLGMWLSTISLIVGLGGRVFGLY